MRTFIVSQVRGTYSIKPHRVYSLSQNTWRRLPVFKFVSVTVKALVFVQFILDRFMLVPFNQTLRWSPVVFFPGGTIPLQSVIRDQDTPADYLCCRLNVYRVKKFA